MGDQPTITGVRMRISILMGATALVGSLALVPVAHAQAGNSAQEDAQAINPNADPRVQAEQEAGELIVTGSRIARPNLDSSVPITSLSASELNNTGNVVLVDRLNDLPALRATLGQSNSISSIVDRRGKGTPLAG